MQQPLYGFPAREEGLALHLHLIDQNPVAAADVCRAYLNPLVDWLAAKFADVDPDLRQTAAHDALMAYVQSPQAYDPARADLASYLRMASRWDLANLRKSEGRHQRGRVGWAVVEDGAEGGNLSGAGNPALQLERAEESQQGRAFLEAVMADFTGEERQVLTLMLAGERKTGVFAAVIGVAGLPAVDQEREVKRVKDRIKKRLERGVPGHA
jgi:RNA polymerase sigma-70 factor (ECF subfamily)